ncbi:MAG: hypothetical protein ACOY32_04065 [Thermodesulfobacteriota bacterium]
MAAKAPARIYSTAEQVQCRDDSHVFRPKLGSYEGTKETAAKQFASSSILPPLIFCCLGFQEKKAIVITTLYESLYRQNVQPGGGTP